MIVIHTKLHRAMTPKFELRPDFCTMHLDPKFHHPVFTRYHVDKHPQTNKHTHKLTRKQTDSAENIQRSSLRYDAASKTSGCYVLLSLLVCYVDEHYKRTPVIADLPQRLSLLLVRSIAINSAYTSRVLVIPRLISFSLLLTL